MAKDPLVYRLHMLNQIKHLADQAMVETIVDGIHGGNEEDPTLEFGKCINHLRKILSEWGPKYLDSLVFDGSTYRLENAPALYQAVEESFGGVWGLESEDHARMVERLGALRVALGLPPVG